MIIHVVTPGESLYSIAQRYGVSENRLITDNGLGDNTALAVGQTLVVQFPEETYTVQPGDTLASIAASFGLDVNQLLRNNPSLNGLPTVFPGQTLVIRYIQEKLGTFLTNGYAYPFIDRAVLRKTLPYLSSITLFTYGFTPTGELVTIDDEEVLAIAREYGVSPILLLSTLTPEGTFNNQLSHTLLNDPALQERLIDALLARMAERGYEGIDVDFEYILPEDRDAYVAFIRRLTGRMNAAGYTVLTALAPKTSGDQPGLLYEAHDYAALGAASNAVLLMTYEWGYTYGPPMAVAPINKVREVLDYAVSVIDPAKIYLGIPNYGYDWTLPFVRGESRARSLSNVEAVELAQRVGAAIQYDETAQAPFFRYYDEQGREHEVWFEDARSIEAKLALIPEYGLLGASWWNIMRFFPQNWLVLGALYLP